MVELQGLTALRPGEVVILQTGDIDMSGRIWIYTPAEHKTEHHEIGREIYLGPLAQAILRPFLKADRMAYLFSPRDADAHHR
jgi:integrase